LVLVPVRRHKHRREIAELLPALIDKHPHEIVYAGTTGGVFVTRRLERLSIGR